MKPKLVIFDLDGTVLDTFQDLTDAMNRVLARHGYPQHTPAAIRSFVGSGIRNLVDRAVPPELPEAQREQVYRAFLADYFPNCANGTKPYPGIPELLDSLRARGIHTAIHSNKAHPAARLLCEKFFPGRIELCLGAREGVPKKPHPQGVEEILAHFALPPEACVYVGDSDVDGQTAKNAGIRALIVTWGFRDRAFLEAQLPGQQLVDSVEVLQSLL